MPHFPIHFGARLPRLEVCAVGQPDPAPLGGVTQPHRAQLDHTAAAPASDRRTSASPDGRKKSNATGSRRTHRLVAQPRWARKATSTISPVRISSASLGNHHQTVRFGQRRQQMRRRARRAAERLHQVLAGVLIAHQLPAQIPLAAGHRRDRGQRAGLHDPPHRLPACRATAGSAAAPSPRTPPAR